MKIFIITQEEPFYLPIGLEKLVSQRKKEIVGATILPRFSKESSWRVLKKLFLLYGLQAFFVQTAEFILFKSLDALFPLIKPKRFYSVRRIFNFFSISIIPTNNINDKNYLKKIKQFKPDIIISFGCPQVFKKEILSLPPLGCINVHGSLLPKYRGKNIGFWILLNQEKETGVTVHYINEKIDAGEIILQKRIKVHPQETVDSLYKKIVPEEGQALIEALELIEKGKTKTKSIDVKNKDYFSDPSMIDIKLFRKMGKKFR